MGVEVGVEKKEKEEGGANADADIDANAKILGIVIRPRRTDTGLLLTQRRLAERKVVATTLPRDRSAAGMIETSTEMASAS